MDNWSRIPAIWRYLIISLRPTSSNMDTLHYMPQGWIQDFLKRGSESGVDIEGGANPSIESLKQGVWGAQPPRSYGVFNFG